MPEISRFFKIIIRMFYRDVDKHHRPHIHAEYDEFEDIIAIDDGEVLEGDLPINKRRLVQAWIEIHQRELMDDWHLAVNDKQPRKIAPLK
jgi:hypothetical protein